MNMEPLFIAIVFMVVLDASFTQAVSSWRYL